MSGVVQAVFKCENRYKEKFLQSQCLITISVGQDSHEGERFAAIVDLINKSFKSCIMIIDDSLQRHTMALRSEKNADFFYPLSLKEGDQWLLRHKRIIDKFSILKKIVRWDMWLNHPNYLIQKNKVINLMTKDVAYRNSFEMSIENFLEKYSRRLHSPEKFNMDRARKLCFDLVVEECVALSLWPELQCQFEAYPNKHNFAIEETREKFISPECTELLRAIMVSFKNAPQLKPQCFMYLEGLCN